MNVSHAVIAASRHCRLGALRLTSRQLMRFVDDRGRGRALVAALVAALVVVARAEGARAAPLEDPFVGGMSFTGPTSPSLAAIYWNPAALGLVRGTQVMVA